MGRDGPEEPSWVLFGNLSSSAKDFHVGSVKEHLGRTVTLGSLLATCWQCTFNYPKLDQRPYEICEETQTRAWPHHDEESRSPAQALDSRPQAHWGITSGRCSRLRRHVVSCSPD